MAINLNTLTSSATSGDVLQEVNTTADFLEGVPLLKNAARGSLAGGSAKQDVALNQPRALPLDANGKGYLYLSGVSGNYASVPDPIGSLDDFAFQFEGLDAGSVRPLSKSTLIAQYENTSNRSFIIIVNPQGKVMVYLYTAADISTQLLYQSALAVPTDTVGIRVTRNGTSLQYLVDTGSGYSLLSTESVVSGPLYNAGCPIYLGSQTTGDTLRGKISRAVIWNNATQSGSPVLDVDFTATNIRHGVTKFRCATNQIVTINTAGLDPAKIIKRPVLRFDGVNDFMQGLLNQTITGGHMFAAFSVLGDGGESQGRIFSMNSTGAADNAAGGFAVYRNALTNGYRTNYNGNTVFPGVGLFDDSMGDVLFESSFKNSSQISMVNNADKDTGTSTLSGVLSSEEFKIVSFTNGSLNAAIDLEFLALFSADSVPDEATAKRIRDYINGRGVHGIYLRHQTDGYYFYDATRAPSGAISSGSSAWSGRIVGSDNGDSASLLATQSTSNDAPVSDGYTVTFADNTDHLDIPQVTLAAGDSYAWMVCGTSLGTFTYKVTVSGETELNLLGHLGHASYRKAGSLYGIILLPELATSADIEAARKLLIDRGAADGATAVNYFAAWVNRSDIVEFKNVEFGSVINFGSAWEANGFTSFPLINTSSGTYFAAAWFNCTSLSDFAPIQATLGNNFTSAWKSCSSLQSFPAGAKLGTSVSNVNFTSAWQSSGLTSFPALDLSAGSNFTSAWQSCSALTSFPAGAKLGTAASNVNFTAAFQSSGLTSFPALDLRKGSNFVLAFNACSNLTSLESGVVFSANASNIAFYGAFLNCTSLVDFPPGAFDGFGTPANDCFLNAWLGCSALSADSVQNILVSIDTSGQSAPSSGPQITIAYNTATGSLSAATNTAVTSLKAKGWSIVVNGVTL